jgi:hypothetical protein
MMIQNLFNRLYSLRFEDFINLLLINQFSLNSKLFHDQFCHFQLIISILYPIQQLRLFQIKFHRIFLKEIIYLENLFCYQNQTMDQCFAYLRELLEHRQGH